MKEIIAMSALGLIETKGLVGAIEAADAMLKAADVRLLEKNQVGGGLVTITVAGEVSAVQASVEAASASVERVKGATLVSRHVIARPDEGLAQLILAERNISIPPAVANAGAPPAGTAPEPGAPSPEEVGTATRHNTAQLRKLSLHELRRLACGLEGVALSPDRIGKSDKKELIEGIIHAYGHREE
jgi:microcompartment protein CcmL/EutN